MPRENPPTMSSRRVVRPARSSAASTRTSMRSSRYTCAKKRRFSAAVNSAYRYKSWPSIPMRDRRALPPWPASMSPYLTAPEVGCSSVAAIDRSVDFPAPLWPRSAVIVPASAVIETLLRARRRPNTRLTSTRRRLSKSTVTTNVAGRPWSRHRLLIQACVEILQRRDELLAPRGVCRGVDFPLPPLGLERGELREQRVALRLQAPLLVFLRRRRTPRRPP